MVLLLCAEVCLTTVVVLVTEYTTEVTRSAVARLMVETDITVVDTAGKSAELELLQPSVVLDFMNSMPLSTSARQEYRAPTRWINGNDYWVEGETLLFAPDTMEVLALAEVTKKLKMARPCLLLSPENRWAEEIFSKSMFPVDVNTLYVSKELSSESMDLIVRREIKAKGFLNLIFILCKESSLSLLRALESNHMDRVPLTLLFSQAAKQARGSPLYPDLAKSGSLYVAAQGCALSTEETDEVYCRLRQLLNSTEVYSVVALQNGTASVIGSASASNASLCANCFSFRPDWNPSSTLSPIQVSFNNGTLNPNGDTNNGERQWYLGTQLALKDINAVSSLLPDHFLRIFNMSLGLNIYNASWALAQAKKFTRDDFGVAFLHCQYSSVVVPMYDLLSLNLSVTIPQIGATQLTPQLSNSTRYPYFSRVIVTSDYFAALYIKAIQHYGWKQIVVMYCDDLFCKDLYKTFTSLAEKAGISIVNPADRRQFPVNMVEYPFDRIEDYKQIVDSKARIVLMLLYGNALFYSVNVFYDLGVRRGDMVFMATTWLTPTVFTSGVEEDIPKRVELLAGAIQYYPVGFFGSFGNTVKQRFIDTYHMQPANKACYYYDELYAVAYAINDLMVLGKDFEDPKTLEKALKSVRFLGCSGGVSMQEGTNDRSPVRFQILNAVTYADGTVNIVEVGIYDPVGVVMFNFTRDIVWSDNTTVIPSDTRQSSIDCPFDTDQVVVYVPGVILAYGVLLTVSLVTLFVTMVIWRLFWKAKAMKMEKKEEISFDDYICFGTIGMEALQYAAMGPPIPTSLTFLSLATESMSVDMESFLYLRKGVYWLFLDGVLGCVFAWTLLVLLAKTHCGEIIRQKIGLLETACEKLLPILGNLCFLPMISILVDIYGCIYAVDEGKGVELTTVYLEKDCYQTCWVYPHFLYVVFASLALSCYVPSAVYFRPTWQEHQPSLHVPVSPANLMLKSIYQIILVTTNALAMDFHSLIHSGIHLIATIMFFVISMKIRPFGYSRANLWNDISLICVIFLSLLSGISLITDAIPPGVFVGVFLGGVGFAVVFGLVYQWIRLPPLLYRPPGIHVVDLFRFQFSRGTKWLYLFTRPNAASLASVDASSSRRLTPPSPRNIIPTFQPHPAESNISIPLSRP